MRRMSEVKNKRMGRRSLKRRRMRREVRRIRMTGGEEEEDGLIRWGEE